MNDIEPTDPIHLMPRQRRFAHEYVIDLNGTAAAIRAGYGARSAATQASDLLIKPEIQALVAALQAKRAEKLEVKSADVLRQAARLAFFDPRHLVDENGDLIPLGDLPDDVALAIQAIEVTRDYKDGKFIGTTTKVKFSDRSRPVDMLMRHLGLYEKDNQQAANPIQALFEHLAARGARLQAHSVASEGTTQAESYPALPKRELLR